jgi:hypothetical protein
MNTETGSSKVESLRADVRKGFCFICGELEGAKTYFLIYVRTVYQEFYISGFGNVTIVYSSKTKPSLGQTNWFNTKIMRFTIQNIRCINIVGKKIK